MLFIFIRSKIVASVFFLSFLQLSICESHRYQVDVNSENVGNSAEVDVVFPMRITRDPGVIASSGHFRKRRSVSIDSDVSSNFENPIYKLRAFDEDIIVRLQPDDDLIAPAFTTVYSRNNTINDVRTFKPGTSLRRCFYKGTVEGDSTSRVALSICDYLTGSISTQNFRYLISPLHKNESAPSSANELLPHSIQRRSTEKSDLISQSSCGVNEARNRRRYKRTFMNELAQKVVERAEQNQESAKKHSRSKRSFESRQHYIETMVVADAGMVEEHGSDLEHYILSIMMLANKIFSHPSLGSAIHLSVVKIMILENAGNHGLKISSNAAHTLRNFCSWQKQHNRPDDTDPDHFDLAILFTKKDLCGESCDTLGMAEVGAMCSSRHSCAIVEDDGLSASQTLAHEVGHVLNMMHDNNRLCRENFNINPSSHVMSSTITRFDDDQPWSLCSRQAVIDFLRDGRGNCLLDKPQRPKTYPNQLPGVMYNVQSQCEMAFGKGAVPCPYMKECSRLWCQLPNGARANQCHTRNFPRADGSPCSANHHCMKGKCVPQGPRAEPVDGSWGSWSQYGSCSRSCGGGVQKASRRCNNPAPQNGGKYCIGSRFLFKSCNIYPCRDGGERVDYRSQQCAAYNGQRFPRFGVRVASTWVPKYSDVSLKDRCKLVCQSLQTGIYITLSDRVVDGTRCGPDTTDICVQGQCQPAGCDGILGSEAKLNKCGLCNVSNKRCKRVRGKYNKQISGYNYVITFPKGAATIQVQQRAPKNQFHDGNYLALVKSNGQYILNGGLTLSTIKKDIQVNGTTLQYTGVRVPTEKIISTMPLKEAITLQVLSLGLSGSSIVRPRIKYSYYIPKRKGNSKQTENHIDIGSDDFKTKRPASRRNSTGDTLHPEVSRWVTGRWSRCKVSGNRKCGVGWKKRKVTCKAGKRRSFSCSARLKPYYRLPCHVSQCPTDAPKKSPRISGPERNQGPTIVNRWNSRDRAPIWNAGLWGSCSVSCGFGTKQRQIICQTRSGRLLAMSMCDHRTKPSSIHGCKLRECR